MTTQALERVPEITLGWRLRIALGTSGLSVEDMAKHFQVSRQTIGRWTRDDATPKKLYLREWARLTGVSLHWIETGEQPIPNPGPGHGEREDNLRRLAERKRSRTSRAATTRYLAAA